MEHAELCHIIGSKGYINAAFKNQSDERIWHHHWIQTCLPISVLYAARLYWSPCLWLFCAKNHLTGILTVSGLTLGVMLFVMQKTKCCCMLSILWRCCCLVVRRYFCSARAIEGNMAWAASRGSITSPGAFFCSSSCMRRMCVNASSTATTSLKKKRVSSHSLKFLKFSFIICCCLEQWLPKCEAL